MVELKKGAPDDEVEKALTKAKKTKFMKEDALPAQKDIAS
jgi:hypothetical protein